MGGSIYQESTHEFLQSNFKNCIYIYVDIYKYVKKLYIYLLKKIIIKGTCELPEIIMSLKLPGCEFKNIYPLN